MVFCTHLLITKTFLFICLFLYLVKSYCSLIALILLVLFISFVLFYCAMLAQSADATVSRLSVRLSVREV